MSGAGPIDELPVRSRSGPEPRPGTPRPGTPSHPSRRSRRGRRLLALAAVGVVFVVGIMIGMAIEDRPRPGGEQTIVNTLRVSTLAPVETVTVTVQSP